MTDQFQLHGIVRGPNSAWDNYVLNSGIYIPSNHSYSSSVYYNPKLGVTPEYTQELLPNPNKVSCGEFSDSDFNDFAKALLAAAEIISRAAPDLVLVPMRGAIRPWTHLKIINQLEGRKCCVFPFTSGEKNSEEVRHIITSAMAPFAEHETVRLLCIDSAKGGQGSKKLLDILEEIQRSISRSEWIVTLCLFIPRDHAQDPWIIKRGEDRSRQFKVHCNHFPVGIDNVPGEDLDGAMIETENFDRLARAKLQVDGKTYLIRTSQLPRVLDQKIAERIHDVLVTQPGSMLINIDTWKQMTDQERLSYPIDLRATI